MSTSQIWPNAPEQGAANWNGQTAQAKVTAASASKPPAPKKYARIPLRTIGEVHAEAARIYRLARSGQMDSADCSRLASVLALISRMIEGGELERRVRALEKRG
jgi:hypothetical protein